MRHRHYRSVGHLPVAGVWDTVTNVFKTGATTAVNVYGEAKKAEGMLSAGQQQAYVTPSGLPSWVLPVGLGLAAVGLIYFLKKRG
jgi:hypothetical protein